MMMTMKMKSSRSASSRRATQHHTAHRPAAQPLLHPHPLVQHRLQACPPLLHPMQLQAVLLCLTSVPLRQGGRGGRTRAETWQGRGSHGALSSRTRPLHARPHTAATAATAATGMWVCQHNPRLPPPLQTSLAHTRLPLLHRHSEWAARHHRHHHNHPAPRFPAIPKARLPAGLA